MDEGSILNELKALILIKTGIRTVTPADCKRISIEISKTLNKNVSETTIKRLFGFAVVKHNFSKFTLTTLAEYVQDDTLPDWPASISVHAESTPLNWLAIKDKIATITDFTLKGIRNRSGMPYHMTISRKFAEHDFEDFLQSNHSFTAFISQPGYGKTILLSHLAEKFQATAPHNGSAVLFIKAYSFFNLDQINLNFEDQLKYLLNISKKESLINYIDNNYKQSGSRLIIFLDGFAELVLKKEIKKKLFDSIINFICTIEHTQSIKLVMAMRCTTWIRFYEMIRHSAYLKTTWFAGNYFNLNDVSNVPQLTEKEVDLIISRMDNLDITAINPKVKAQLKFPFHIQLYYQLREENPEFNFSTNITFHELISRFIQEKIYRSNYYTEKILFLKKIVQLTSFGKNGNFVPKDNLIAELSAFKNAYMELLADGILMEEKRHEDYHPREFVRFIHPHIFEYFLFIELLEKFNLQVGRDFFQYIQTEYESENVRFQLFQWTIRFIVRIGDLKLLSNIFDLSLRRFEHNYLILFVAENLKYRARYNSDTVMLLKEHKFHDVIIEELVNFDFVDSCYKEALNVLLELSDSNNHGLIYQSVLSILDMMSLDTEKIAIRLSQMARYETRNWAVDPYEVTMLIYSKISNKNIQKSELISDIENQIYSFLKPGRPLDTQQGITYFMAMLLNFFYGSDEGAVKLIETIISLHPKEFSKRSAFTIFLMNLLAFYCSRINLGKKTDQMERILTMLHDHKSRFNITKYSESILKMTQAYQLKNKGEYLLATQYCEDCIQLFKRNELNLQCILMYNLLITIYSEMNIVAKVNEYKYERICFMEDKNIAGALFALPRELTSFKHR